MNAANKPTAGDLFGTSSRAKGLGGKLPPRRHQIHDPLADAEPAPATTQEPEAAAPEPTAPAATPKTKAPSKAKPKPKPAAPAPAAGEDPSNDEQAERESNENYQVYVPADVIARFRKRRLAEGTTNGLLFMDAVDYVVDLEADDPYQLLRELVAKTLVGGGGEKPSLFKREPKRVKTDLGPRSQLMLRLSPDEQNVVEMLVRETRAVDRGHLATVAISYYLDNAPGPEGD